jgi:hypothetical protein
MAELASILLGMTQGEAPESFRNRVQALCDAYPLP